MIDDLIECFLSLAMSHEDKKCWSLEKWNFKWISTCLLILLWSMLLQQHVKSYVCSLMLVRRDEWAARQAKKPDHFFFQLRISSKFICISLSVSFRFHVIFLLRSCRAVKPSYCPFLVSFSSTLFVSFGYTIQRVFIIQFSFFSDVKRRSSTWIGQKSWILSVKKLSFLCGSRN